MLSSNKVRIVAGVRGRRRYSFVRISIEPTTLGAFVAYFDGDGLQKDMYIRWGDLRNIVINERPIYFKEDE